MVVIRRRHWPRILLLPACLVAMTLSAATPPDDRVEALYHSYDGGGVQVTGPALFARKTIGKGVSASAQYYVDTITSASIDVVTSASEYDEERTEYSLGVDWVYGDSEMAVGYSHSNEDDYTSDTYSLLVTQEVFGGMSSISMGYSHGDDVVERVDTDFRDKIDRDRYGLGLAQVLTPTMIATLNYEAVLEDGDLNNPYRSARILGAQIPERYPRTRTSQAAQLRLLKSWNRETSLNGSYQYFTDTWGIQANTFEIGASHYVDKEWLIDLSYRYYTQDAASFYSDNFDREYNYMARDKELSTFNYNTLGARVTWNIQRERLPLGLNNASFTVGYDYMMFSYDDFTDIRTGEKYDFNSHVFQIYFTSRY
ncbi:MAG: DUF3570 domain-containing protein [Gammaproteobacteria bacterium]